MTAILVGLISILILLIIFYLIALISNFFDNEYINPRCVGGMLTKGTKIFGIICVMGILIMVLLMFMYVLGNFLITIYNM